MEDPIPTTDAVFLLENRLLEICSAEARAWFHDARRKIKCADPAPLAALFPALVRRFGREPLREPTDPDRFLRSEHFLLDLAALRRADAAGVVLAMRVVTGGGGAGFLRHRFDEGDIEERTTVLRTLALLGQHPVALDLAREAQRSNTLDHFEAAACDTDFAARCLPLDDFNRMALKMAFLDLPEWRMLRGLERANPELSRMLQDFATEREAAGRPVWLGTLPFVARAPVDGTRARVIGHLEHGDDRQRLAAARAAGLLREAGMARFVQERVTREPRAEIREALEHSLRALPKG